MFDDPRRPANFARFQFLDPRSHDFYADWEGAANITVALLRAEAGRRPHDTQLRELVGELSTVSEEFRTRWAAHDVRIHHNGTKQFHHPVVGTARPRLLHPGPARRGPRGPAPDHLHRRAGVGVGGRAQAAGQLGGHQRRRSHPGGRPHVTWGSGDCAGEGLSR